jgi:hypothetical protein
MKKIFISLSSILIIGFFGCKKEINTETAQEEVIATAKPPAHLLQLPFCNGKNFMGVVYMTEGNP